MATQKTSLCHSKKKVLHTSQENTMSDRHTAPAHAGVLDLESFSTTGLPRPPGSVAFGPRRAAADRAATRSNWCRHLQRPVRHSRVVLRQVGRPAVQQCDVTAAPVLHALLVPQMAAALCRRMGERRQISAGRVVRAKERTDS